MRARPILLVTLVVLWGTTWTGAAAASAEGDAGHDAAPVTDLFIQAGSAPPERVHLRLSDVRDRATVYESTLDPEPDTETHVRVPIGPGLYRLSLRGALLVHDDGAVYHPKSAMHRIDLEECTHRSRITVHLDDDHLSVHHDDTGCLDLPASIQRLAASARHGAVVAKDTRPGPSLASSGPPTMGLFVATQRLDTTPDDPTHAPAWGDTLVWFERHADAPLLDVAALPPGTEWLRILEARSDDDGNARGAWTEGLVAYDPTTGQGAAASRKGLTLGWKDAVTPVWQRTTLIDYHRSVPFPECLATVPSDGNQGHTIHQLATCIGVPGHAAWRRIDTTAPDTEHLVATWPRSNGDGVATITWTGTGSVPSRIHVYDRNEAGIVTHTGAWLDSSTLRHHEDTTPSTAVPFTNWPTPAAVPLDPMRGPTDPDATNDPFAFPLSAAADAARRDPVIGPRIAEVDDRGGILAGAVYRHDPTIIRLQRSLGTELTYLGEPEWALLFARGPFSSVAVVCRIAPTVPATDAAIHCRPDDEGIVTKRLGQPPFLHRHTLPAVAPSWSGSVHAWQPHDPDAAPRMALYRAWHTGPDADERAFLSVGDDLANLSPEATIATGREAPRDLRIELATGQPLWYRTTRFETETGPDIANVPRSPPTANERAPDIAVPPAPGHTANLVTFTIGLGIVAAAAAWHRLPLRRLGQLLPAVTLWARRDEPGDRHPIRIAILEQVSERPGIIRARLKSHLRVRNGQLDHHLDVLLARGEIFEVRERGARCFFRTGSVDNDEAYRLAALANPRLRAARDLVRSQPGVTVTGLAEALDVSKGHASRLVHRLAATGHVRVERDANRLRAFPCEPA